MPREAVRGPAPRRTPVPTARPLTRTSGSRLWGTHLAGVGSLDSLSGQRLGLQSPGVPVLGRALPCIQGGHAHRPGGGHAHGAQAGGAHQRPHTGRVQAAGSAGPPGPSVLQELAAESLPGPHLEEKRHIQARPPWRAPGPSLRAPPAAASLPGSGLPAPPGVHILQAARAGSNHPTAPSGGPGRAASPLRTGSAPGSASPEGRPPWPWL